MSERAPDFHWNGQPVYRCQTCGDHYERVANLAAVLNHEAQFHGPTVRASLILGSGGETLMVAEEEETKQAGRRRK